MTNRIILFTSIIAIFYSCSKDNDTPQSNARGTIIGSPVLLGTSSKSQLATTIGTIVGNNAQYLNYNYDVAFYKINYNTIDPAGNPTLASGLIIAPKDSTKSFPLLSWQHGTTVNRTAVPSNFLFDEADFGVGLIFATGGFVVACPDYLGMGDGTKLNLYLHAKSEATAVIDMLKATRLFCKDNSFQLNDQLFLAGYSQGGHSTMAALKMIEERYSAEFTVTACSPMAGPYDLSETQLNFMMRDSAFPHPGFLPYTIFAYNSVYNMYPDLSSIFVSPYYNEFKRYLNDTIYNLVALENIYPSSKIPSAVLKPEVIESIKQDRNNPIVLALKENNLYDWEPKSPMHLCHCDGDDMVSYQNSVVAYNSFIKHGSLNVKLVTPMHSATHNNCFFPSIMDAYTWFGFLKK